MASCPHSPEFDVSLPKIEEGSEHAVFFNETEALVYKLTLPDVFGDWYYLRDGKMTQEKSTPIDYLFRMRLWDKLFRPGPEVLGVTAKGQIVSNQKFISGTYPSQESVDTFLHSAGLVPVKQEFWLWKKEYPAKEFAVWIGDARADNFVQTDQGVIPIDLRLWFAPT